MRSHLRRALPLGTERVGKENHIFYFLINYYFGIFSDIWKSCNDHTESFPTQFPFGSHLTFCGTFIRIQEPPLPHCCRLNSALCSGFASFSCVSGASSGTTQHLSSRLPCLLWLAAVSLSLPLSSRDLASF